jgi:hypothetical protein
MPYMIVNGILCHIEARDHVSVYVAPSPAYLARHDLRAYSVIPGHVIDVLPPPLYTYAEPRMPIGMYYPSTAHIGGYVIGRHVRDHSHSHSHSHPEGGSGVARPDRKRWQ